MPARPERSVLAVVAAAGLSSGVVLLLIALAIARVSPPAPGQLVTSDALWIPLGTEPALLAAGWAALVMRWRGHGGPLTCAAAVLAGLVDIPIGVYFAWLASAPPDPEAFLAPFVFWLFAYALVNWTFGAPALVTALPAGTSGTHLSGRSTFRAMALLLVATAVGACGFVWAASRLLA